MMLIFDSNVKECVIIVLVPMIEKRAKKTFTIMYIHKIPTYNIRSKMQVLIPLRTYFGPTKIFDFTMCVYTDFDQFRTESHPLGHHICTPGQFPRPDYQEVFP